MPIPSISNDVGRPAGVASAGAADAVRQQRQDQQAQQAAQDPGIESTSVTLSARAQELVAAQGQDGEQAQSDDASGQEEGGSRNAQLLRAYDAGA